MVWCDICDMYMSLLFCFDSFSARFIDDTHLVYNLTYIICAQFDGAAPRGSNDLHACLHVSVCPL